MLNAVGNINNIGAEAISNSKLSKVNQAAENVKTMSVDDIEKVSSEFEAMFLSQLLSAMFETVEVDELFGGGFAEETFRGMIVDEYGKTLSQSGGIGVADHVQNSLLKLQESSTNTNH